MIIGTVQVSKLLLNLVKIAQKNTTCMYHFCNFSMCGERGGGGYRIRQHCTPSSNHFLLPTDCPIVFKVGVLAESIDIRDAVFM